MEKKQKRNKKEANKAKLARDDLFITKSFSVQYRVGINI